MRRHQVGSAVVEYLMLVVLISAVAVPIIYNKFGGPFVDTLRSERSKLVNFIGQTPKGRKPPVPSAWFSQEKAAKPDSQAIGGAENLGDQPPLENGELGQPGNIKTGDLNKGPGSGGDLKDPQGINVGGVGGGGIGSGATGGAGGGGGSMGGGSDFFSNPPETPGRASGGQGEGDEEGGGGRRRSGGDSAEVQEGRGDGPGGKGASAARGAGAKGEGSKQLDGKKRSLVEAEQELKERTESGKFDWWLLIKILIVLFIIALVFLIMIGNTRRSG